MNYGYDDQVLRNDMLKEDTMCSFTTSAVETGCEPYSCTTFDRNLSVLQKHIPFF